jgi:hypothetical protein
MRATGWNNGAWHASGAGYGIKIDKDDRDNFFREEWPEVQIELASGVTTTVSISESCWNLREIFSERRKTNTPMGLTS